MSNGRFYSCLLLASLLSGPVLAKNETLVERGKRLCDEKGIQLENCLALPPGLRREEPDTEIGQAEPVFTPIALAKPLGATMSAERYGWCNDCTSAFGPSAVEPWSTFGGRQRQRSRDEDNRDFARAETSGTTGGGGGGDNGGGGGGGDNGGGGGGDNGGGGGGDNGGGGGGDNGGGGGNCK